ncbi:phosphoethanolamine--lipid A transferase [Roseobacter sp. N2S]|uniref:phosphoethanolamine transferase n=1 Tax=Roseobacter sp. N2S TaxID=2663844 RepID=UPI0028625597|nr:phosphoethanolamine--lipid A transferase [Roseobacter sp. N2S]MDR6264488.1 lipid A ethanolaminephosphotransferase [Roseobacter sp. N2S]
MSDVTLPFQQFFQTRGKPLHLSPLTLSAAVGLFVMLADNATFWTIGAEVFSGHMPLLGIFAVALFFLFLAFLALFSFRPIVRPALAIILILSAVTSFYMDKLGVFIDREMIQNVVTTTFTESKHLITLQFISHVIFFGVLPALALFWVKVKKQSLLVSLGTPLLVGVVSLALCLGLLLTNYKAYSAVLRERKDLMSSFQPGAPIVGTVRYVKMVTRAANAPIMPLGLDAHKGAAYVQGAKPVLTIIVAGETARAENFSLNGYAVDTNPELAKQPITYFTNVSSCGTATAVSLPCMFSNFTRKDYSYEKGVSNENLLDVLDHAGFSVTWWDNNTGDKGLAKRQDFRSFEGTKDAEFCARGECDDGVFMKPLQNFAASITQDTVLVLHQIGSHGPTYKLRYPEGFAKFTPDCQTAEFKNCTQQEIVNAYDNTIAYTDHVLSQTIDFLTTQTNLATSLIYVSDHGESLGENGLYLHGAPYFLAPSQQTHVPMVVWMSPSYQKQFSIETACLQQKADQALSHDNLFHSVLGLLDVQTTDYNAAQDIFATCKTRKDS